MTRSRTAVLTTIAVLGAVPVASGLAGIVRGPAGAPGGAPTSASVDSEYRFVNVFWAAAGVILWWSLRRPDERARVTRLMLELAAVGGLPRVISWMKVGAPHPVFRATIVLEFVVVPAVLVWHSRALSSD
ncbi:DUF4345 domain-containing protein [Subtercola endophyticus]|uniref:DUF4345 domain-containing protein n=1 Tax=Subtercola endophyticus TaxID=2895559 RepID=UPI001E31E301|nr:DUF4345 domain-containing protein [Subtercola endophyticus]UFS60638.1 DUF4345 domain-containing protein [Subtercola endophyticus]